MIAKICNEWKLPFNFDLNGFYFVGEKKKTLENFF